MYIQIPEHSGKLRRPPTCWLSGFLQKSMYIQAIRPARLRNYRYQLLPRLPVAVERGYSQPYPPPGAQYPPPQAPPQGPYYPQPPQQPPGYQGYFNDGQQPYGYPPPHGGHHHHGHHHHHDDHHHHHHGHHHHHHHEEDDCCLGFLKGCLIGRTSFGTCSRIHFSLGSCPFFIASGRTKPLQIWDKEVVNGHIKRPQDEDIQSNVLEIIGTNVQSTYITCPADPSATLGIKLPFLAIIVKNLKKYFTFEIQVLDDKNVRRRFRASNFQVLTPYHHLLLSSFSFVDPFTVEHNQLSVNSISQEHRIILTCKPFLQSVTRVKPYICTMPLKLDDGWNNIQLNLADLTKRAYGTNYVETLRVQVHANCRLRRIYFSDRLYSEEELPPEFKLYLPIQVRTRRCLYFVTLL
ncbi:Cilia- and flagella-associated protein 20 [Dichanthelium oligosanthes]|uniref:Cilia-and flagella-associated protein 20 n=1 Tax=Dichanthelium oligosanthes TaxID=888268 RepID=A0A1E5V4M3_9POAL|nr:Cilia- and flagella-associated protein 20 [Dichanthelium oligosanthes]